MALILNALSAEIEAIQRTEDQEEQLTKVFLDFLAAQDDAYQGSFEEYYWDRFGELSPTVPMRAGWAATEEDARVSSACTAFSIMPACILLESGVRRELHQWPFCTPQEASHQSNASRSAYLEEPLRCSQPASNGM